MIRTFPLSNLPHDVRLFWEGAVATNEKLTPFHSYGWLSDWSIAYDMLDEAIVLVEYSPAGLPRVLLPMLNTNGELRSLPLNASDYTGSVWQDLEIEAFRSIAVYLQDAARRIPIFLWNIRSLDPLVRILAERDMLNHQHETTILFAEINQCAYRPERASGSISQKELAFKRSKLIGLGAETRFTNEITDGELLRILRIHTARWRLKGKLGNFADPCRVKFVHRLVKGHSVALLFATMWIKGELLAYRFGPYNGRVYYDWNTGFNPSFRHFSPGVVLLESIVTHLKTSRRIQFFDFLRGAEEYKLAWASGSSSVHEFMVTA